MRRLPLLLGVLFAGLSLPRQLPAQLPFDPFPVPDILPLSHPWIGINYPKVFWTPKDGLTGGVRLSMIRQISSRDYYHPAPYSAALIIDGQLSTSSSRQLTVEFNAPRWADGWRFKVRLSGSRKARDNYFGIGNDTDIDDSLDDEFYESVNERLAARADVQRRIAGGLRAWIGVNAERWELSPRSGVGPTQLGQDSLAGIPRVGVPTTDVSWRAGLVFDTRDDEISTDRGVLIEAVFAVADSSFAGDEDYTRTTVTAAGFLPLSEKSVVAARVVGQGMGGSPTIGALSLIESSQDVYDGLGGDASHRALPENRLIGRHKLFANLDYRYHVINLPRTIRATLVGFLDVGRVFENGQDFELTLDDMKVGGGVGLFLQVTRAGIVGTTAGVGPDGLRVHFHSRWPF